MSPVTYCELTEPGRRKRPGFRRPDTENGGFSPEKEQPRSLIASVREPSGRLASRPRTFTENPPHSAAATGRRKRSVEPLSPQSSSGAAPVSAEGAMSTPELVGEIIHPSADRQRSVALISSEFPEKSI